MMRTVRGAFALAAASVLLLGAPAGAVEERTFKITQVFASTHWHWNEGMKIFTEAVTEASGGKITFEVYHAGQLGKDTTTLVTSGLADFGLLVPSYESEKLPLTSVVELPGFHKTACEGTAKFWAMSQEGGALFEEEYAKLGVRPLYVMVLPPYEVQTNAREVTSLADMQGLKLRANGAAMAKTVSLLGGVPVTVTSNEFYDALSRGTVDGGMWLSGSTRLVGLEKVLNFAVKGTELGAGSTFFAIGEKVWQGLDEETRKILFDAGAKTQAHVCKYLDKSGADEEKWLVDNGFLKLNPLPPEELARWKEATRGVADDWAKDANSTGRPGTRLLEAYRKIAAGM